MFKDQSCQAIFDDRVKSEFREGYLKHYFELRDTFTKLLGRQPDLECVEDTDFDSEYESNGGVNEGVRITCWWNHTKFEDTLLRVISDIPETYDIESRIEVTSWPDIRPHLVIGHIRDSIPKHYPELVIAAFDKTVEDVLSRIDSDG